MKNTRKIVLGLMVTAALMTACDNKAAQRSATGDAVSDDMTMPGGVRPFAKFVPVPETQAGDFLASHFAQSQYDWAGATKYLDRVLAQQPNNTDLLKRSMILAVGSGEMDRAAQRAQTVLTQEPKNGLALLVLSVQALSKNETADAQKYLTAMPDGDLTSFVKPLLLGWVKAGQGQLETQGFNATTIHMYHAACMALMLHKEDRAREFARKMLDSGSLGVYDAERAGDLFAALGERVDAMTLYKNLLAQEGGNAELSAKIDALKKNDGSISDMLQPLKIKTAQQGAALAMYDMAFVLYSEYSDTSAKIFAQMADALNPQMIDAHLLLGDILARNGRYDEAIKYFESVPKTDRAYLPSERHAAELLADADRRDEAKKLLNKLYDEDHDLESLIRLGDLYREDEDYGSALKIYNRAADALGGATWPMSATTSGTRRKPI
jgi:tetratricopeptide (TPR) repeat protein